MQISMMSEFIYYKREKFPNVDGVVAIPHNKGCGCQDGSNLEIMLRTLSNYADHPNVGGVILMDSGCEKTNLRKVEKYLLKRELEFNKPVAKIGIQEIGGTQAAIEKGLEEVKKMLPIVNENVREEFPVSELVLGVKCGSSDGFSGLSANPVLGNAADILVRSHGTVLITEDAANQLNREFLPFADVVFGVISDDFKPSVAEFDERKVQMAAEKMLEEFPNIQIIISTLRDVHNAGLHNFGAACFADNRVIVAGKYEKTNVLNRVGSGDAFVSGFIYSLLNGKDLQFAADFGAAHGVSAMTSIDDNSTANIAEIEELMRGESSAAKR